MIEVTVTPSETVSMGRGPTRGSWVPTHTHIPGTVLRGALARAWLIEHGRTEPGSPQRDKFCALFERGVRFGPLFAPGSMVVPLSVRRCKYRSIPECAQVWHDEAEQTTPPAACEHCGGPLEPGRGEVEFVVTGSPVRRRTRVALDKQETAREGMLYDRDEIPADPQRSFTGRITGGGDWLHQPHELFIGSKLSTRGAADYLPSPGQDRPVPDKPERRLVLRLLSPAILVDECGRPTLEPNPAALQQALGCGVRIERRWTRRERLHGWHAASDMPKPEEHAVTAGSSFLLELDDEPDPQRLSRLLDKGLGLRRVEGFGAVELGTATPPEPATRKHTTTPTPPTSEATHVLTQLAIPMMAWVLRRLRQYRAHLSDGGTPHSKMLRTGRADELTPEARRVLSEVLHRGQTTELSDLVQALDAAVRKDTT